MPKNVRSASLSIIGNDDAVAAVVSRTPRVANLGGTPKCESQRLTTTSTVKPMETDMSKEQKGNRESKKPKKEKIKTIAAAPSQKTAGWQPTFGTDKKK
jgi:hypothetical protein